MDLLIFVGQTMFQFFLKLLVYDLFLIPFSRLVSGVRADSGKNVSSQGSKQEDIHATRIFRYNNRKD